VRRARASSVVIVRRGMTQVRRSLRYPSRKLPISFRQSLEPLKRKPRRLCLEKNAPSGSYTAWVSKFLLKRWTGFLAEFSMS
jgi:hypothetical protein